MDCVLLIEVYTRYIFVGKMRYIYILQALQEGINLSDIITREHMIIDP